MTRRLGRCARGLRLLAPVPHGHWKTTTLVAGLRSTGIIAPYVLDGAMNGALFRGYIEQILAPTLSPGDIVVMDNLPAYGYDQRIEAFGEKGMLQAGNRRATTVEAWDAERTEAKDPVLHFFIERYTEAYMAEIDHFVDCVEKSVQPLAGFAEGREALRLADAALESLRTGKAVRLDR
jgi:hypothetical protein